MALAAGTRLGAYEITGSLGAGGMGEVYRATDTKLGRDVAVKTLPSALAQDADRLARFEREAKLLATLNHAHIAAIYGLDEHEGTQYLAMELVEGETLQEKLKEGPLPVEDALHLALQIAEALEAAHEKGVVHRDLKPANIMVTGDGQVKVLDFGLAKAFSGDPNEASPAHSPALSMAMTQQGLILGTAGYMSPEQASGQATDQRADVWAFGVVLYEMLTGLPLFSGESVPHILADVLKTEPDWNRLPKHLHPRLKQLLERCLEKKVRNRYYGIADARVDIEKILDDPEGTTGPTAIAEPIRPIWRRVLPVAVGVVVGAFVTGLAVWGVMRPGTPPLARFDITPDGGLTVTADSSSAVVSPDGKSIAYVTGGTRNTGAQELRLRRLDQLGSTTLVTNGQQHIASPFFSPDGTQIGFYTIGNTVLKRVSTEGGPALTIVKLPAEMRGASWGADGTIVYGTQDKASGLWRVRATGGTPEMLTKPDPKSGVVNHWWPEILPGGKAVLFTMVGTSEQDSKIAVLSLTTGKQRVLLRDAVSPHYSPTGHLLFGRGGTIFAVGFDAARLQVEGDPVPVQQGVVTKGVGATEASLASNGTLVYVPDAAVAQRREDALVWVDHHGHEEALGLKSCGCVDPSVSPDGTHVAVSRRAADIWVASIANHTFTRLTFEPGQQVAPVWSPDGKRIAYLSAGQGIVVRKADGTGSPEQLLKGSAPQPWGWTPDGKLIFSDSAQGTYDIGVVATTGNHKPQWLLKTQFNTRRAALSPDGRWLAYDSDESGRSEIYVRPYPNVQSGKWQISADGGREPRWSRNGDKLFFLGPKSLMAASVENSNAFAFDPPKAVLDRGDYLFPGGSEAYDVSPDGQKFLLLKPETSDTPPPRIVVVQNWLPQLERLMPAR